ncbi:MAG: glutamyl-tRNA(Gln) amidotransferase subunit [Pseudomonadota bacterium]|jgi:aspartyl-tRNA(Asn)/glutamyl-tRNA(Gln) amidotransferase subunit C
MSYNRLFEFAKIPFSEKLLNDLFSITSWQEQLQSVDTNGVEPLFNVLDNIKKSSIRDDLIVINNSPKNILQNAPVVDNNYIVVPSVINADE